MKKSVLYICIALLFAIPLVSKGANNETFSLSQTRVELPIITKFEFQDGKFINLTGQNFIGVTHYAIRLNGKITGSAALPETVKDDGNIQIIHDFVKVPLTCSHEIGVYQSTDGSIPTVVNWFTLSTPTEVMVTSTEAGLKSPTSFDYIVTNACPNTTVVFDPNNKVYYSSGGLTLTTKQRNMTIKGNLIKGDTTVLDLINVPYLNTTPAIISMTGIESFKIENLNITDSKPIIPTSASLNFRFRNVLLLNGGLLSVNNLKVTNLYLPNVVNGSMFGMISTSSDTLKDRVIISNSSFHNNDGRGTANVLSLKAKANVFISNSNFSSNYSVSSLLWIDQPTDSRTVILNSNFSLNRKVFSSNDTLKAGNVYIKSNKVLVQNCNFDKNFYSISNLATSHALFIVGDINPTTLTIDNCNFNENGAPIANYASVIAKSGACVYVNSSNALSKVTISKTSFYKNYGGVGTAIYSTIPVLAKNNTFLKNVNTGGSIIYTTNSDTYINNTFAANQGLQGPAVTFVQPGYGLFLLPTSFSPGISFSNNIFYENKNYLGFENNFNTNKSIISNGYNAFLSNNDGITINALDKVYTSSFLMQMEPAELVFNNKYYWKPTCISPLVNQIVVPASDQDMFGKVVQNVKRDIGSFEVFASEDPLFVNSTLDEMRCGSIRVAEAFVNLNPLSGREIKFSPILEGKNIDLLNPLLFKNGANNTTALIPSTNRLIINSGRVNVKLTKSKGVTDFDMITALCPIDMYNIAFNGTRFNTIAYTQTGLNITLPTLASKIDSCVFWNHLIGVKTNSADISNSKFYANQQNDIQFTISNNVALKPAVTTSTFGLDPINKYIISAPVCISIQRPAIIGKTKLGNTFYTQVTQKSVNILEIETSKVSISDNYFGKDYSTSFLSSYNNAIYFKVNSIDSVTINNNIFQSNIFTSGEKKSIGFNQAVYNNVNGFICQKIDWSINEYLGFRTTTIDTSQKYIQGEIKSPVILSVKDKKITGRARPNSKVFAYWTETNNLALNATNENLNYSGVSATTNASGIFTLDFNTNYDSKKRYIRLLQTDVTGNSSVFTNQVIIGCEEFQSQLSLEDNYTFCDKIGTLLLNTTLSNVSSIFWYQKLPSSTVFSLNSSPTAVSNSFTVQSSGSYFPLVYFNNGCILNGDTTQVTFQVNGSSIVLDSVITQPDCPESTNGIIEIKPRVASSNYSYKWDDGAIGNIRSKLSIGNYKVLVTDNISKCTKEFGYELTPNHRISLEYYEVPIFCATATEQPLQLFNTDFQSYPTTYAWSSSDLEITNVTDITVVVKKVKNTIEPKLNVQITQNGCVLEETFNVEVQDSIDIKKLDLTFSWDGKSYPFINKPIYLCDINLPTGIALTYDTQNYIASILRNSNSLDLNVLTINQVCQKSYIQEFIQLPILKDNIFTESLNTGSEKNFEFIEPFKNFKNIELVRYNPFKNADEYKIEIVKANVLQVYYKSMKNFEGMDTAEVELKDDCGFLSTHLVQINNKNTPPKLVLANANTTVGTLIGSTITLIVSDLENNIDNVSFSNLPYYLSYDASKNQIEIIKEIPESVFSDTINYVIEDFTGAMTSGRFSIKYKDKIIEPIKVAELVEFTKDDIKKKFVIERINTAVSQNKGLMFKFLYDGVAIKDQENLEYNLTITSRWGDVVYSEFGIGKNQEWKGEYRGKNVSGETFVSDGDYFYVISVKYKSKDGEGSEFISGSLYFMNREIE